MVTFSTEPEIIRSSSPHQRQGSDASTSTTGSDVHLSALPAHVEATAAVKRMPFVATPYPTKGNFPPASCALPSEEGPFRWLQRALHANPRPAAPQRQMSEFGDEAIAQLEAHEWAKEHLTDPVHDPRDRHVKIVDSVPGPSQRKYGHNRTGSRSRSLTAADLVPPST